MAYSSTSTPYLCTCYNGFPAPAGRYRAKLNVYNASAGSVIDPSNARELTVDFVYPDDDGVVTLVVPVP